MDDIMDTEHIRDNIQVIEIAPPRHDGLQPTLDPALWIGSMPWMGIDVPSLQDCCTAKQIRCPTLDLTSVQCNVTRKLSYLQECFANMSDYERFACGYKHMLFAGIDEVITRTKTASGDNSATIYECIQEVKSCMHHFAMSIGDDQMYCKYVDAVNVFSSLSSYYTLPRREYYKEHREYRDDVQYIIDGKFKCLTRVCQLISLNSLGGISISMSEQETRKILYLDMPSNANRTLAVMLRMIIPPRVFDAVAMIAKTGEHFDTEYMKSLNWNRGISPSTESIELIIESVCERERVDMLEWLVRFQHTEAYRNTVLQQVAKTSVRVLKQLLDRCKNVLPMNPCQVYYLYMGAFNNPDPSCLWFLTELNLKPPPLMSCLGGVCAASMTTRQSHADFLNHIISELKYPLRPAHFGDFVQFADVKCMNIYLKHCGEELLSLFKSDKIPLSTVLSNCNGTYEAKKNLADYLLSNLMHHPTPKVVSQLMNMCSDVFVDLPHGNTYTCAEKLEQMKVFASYYASLRQRYTEMGNFQVSLKTRMEMLDSPQHMIPQNEDSLSVIEYLHKELGVSLNMCTFTLTNCLECQGLLEYLQKFITKHEYLRITDMFGNNDAIFHHSPHKVLNIKSLLLAGHVKDSLINEYIVMYNRKQIQSLRDTLALGILSRTVTDKKYLLVSMKELGLPPADM